MTVRSGMASRYVPGLLAAALLAAACHDAAAPEAGTAQLARGGRAKTVQAVGTGTLGLGPAIPGGDRRTFDFDASSRLQGRVFYRDWSVVRVDGTAGWLRVADGDAGTRISAFRSTSSECADPSRGAEVEGIGRVNTGGDTNPEGDELLAFTLIICDDGPAESGLDLLAMQVPGHGYAAGPDRLTSGDVARVVH